MAVVAVVGRWGARIVNRTILVATDVVEEVGRGQVGDVAPRLGLEVAPAGGEAGLVEADVAAPLLPARVLAAMAVGAVPDLGVDVEESSSA